MQVEGYYIFHDELVITNGEPYQNSVSWEAAECHCQVAEFCATYFKFNSQVQTQ